MQQRRQGVALVHADLPQEPGLHRRGPGDHHVVQRVRVDQRRQVGRRGEPEPGQRPHAALADAGQVALPDVAEQHDRQHQRDQSEPRREHAVVERDRAGGDDLVQRVHQVAVEQRVVQPVGGADEVLGDVEHLVAEPRVDHRVRVGHALRAAAEVVGVPDQSGVADLVVGAAGVPDAHRRGIQRADHPGPRTLRVRRLLAVEALAPGRGADQRLDRDQPGDHRECAALADHACGTGWEPGPALTPLPVPDQRHRDDHQEQQGQHSAAHRASSPPRSPGRRVERSLPSSP